MHNKSVAKKMQHIIMDNRFEIYAILFCILVLYEVIWSGTVHDDAQFYYLHGAEVCEKKSFLQLTWDALVGNMMRGRFFPLSIHAYFVYYIVHDNLMLYKSIIIIAVCVNIWQFGVLTYEIYNNKRVKIISMITLPAFFQVYNTYHNAILGYHLFMQIMVFFLLEILIHLQRYEKSTKKKDMIYVICWMILSMMTYEIGFVYAGMILVVLLFKPQDIKRKIQELSMIIIPTLIMGIINLILKKMYVVDYDGISVNFSLRTIMKTWIIQLINAIPMTHVGFARGDGTLPNNLMSYFSKIDLHMIITLVFFILIYVKLNKCYPQVEENIRIDYRWIVAPTMALLGIGFLIALTKKYQNELYLGISHISVYIEYFLLLYVVIAIAMSIFSRGKMALKKEIYVCVMIMVILSNMICTKISVASINATIKYRMLAVENALKNGILDDVAEEETILVTENDAWLNQAFFAEFTGKKYNLITKSDLETNPRVEIGSDRISILHFNANANNCMVVLGEDGMISEEGEIECKEFTIYTDYNEENKIYYEDSIGQRNQLAYGDVNVVYNDWRHILLKGVDNIGIQFDTFALNWR